MAAKQARGYSRQGVLFRNWQEKEGLFCPVCDKCYITKVPTSLSVIYVHAYGVLCQRKDDEIGT